MPDLGATGGAVAYSLRSWVGPAMIIVGVQALVCTALAAWFEIILLPPVPHYALVGISLVILFGSGCLLLQMLRHEATPLWEIRNRIATHKQQLVHFVVGTGLVIAQFAMLTWAKSVLPETTGIWADPVLANVEARLFGGDLWRAFHFADLWWIEIPYNFWLVVILCGIIFFVACDNDRAIVAFFLTMSLGVVTIYLLPSGGPIFFERLGFGNRFAELPIPRATQLGADFLWSVHSGRRVDFGAGISAMPSMHVAMAMWLALFSTRLRLIAWSYFALILFGSVYLGWHYLLDGVAGAFAAYACYRLAPLVLALSAPNTGQSALPQIRGRSA